MLLQRIRRHLRKDNPRWIILMIDIGIVLCCFFSAYFVIGNFNGNFDVSLMVKKSILVLSVYLVCFLWMKSYRGIIRQTGINDAVHIFKTVGLAGVVLSLFTLLVRATVITGAPIEAYSRLSYSMIVMHTFLTMVVMVAARVLYRSVYDSLFFPHRKHRNVLIFGASRPGMVAFSLLRGDRRYKNHVVAFVEDKPNRIGKRLADLNIVDIMAIDAAYIERLGIEEVVIAVENDDPERLSRVTDHFHALDIELKIMPTAHHMLNGGTAKRQIRKLKIEDLLGRKPIQMDNPVVRQELMGRRILVTGAAGSIGSELARQIALQEYSELILVDQAESALYNVQQTLRAKDSKRTRFIVGDVRDRMFMRHIFEMYRPEIIFHAAAYKHVPLMEENPYEALWTNVNGTRILADLALEFKAYKFVMVSTDKAVNPTNVMGATKRAAEIYVSSSGQQGKTNFIITRFGNVLGSNGSVIPLFEKQLEQGGPLTLTHPDITRYFMTIPEACQLVQEAAAMGNGGEIFVFDMGKSVKIIDLAKRMIHLKGLRYPQDIDIRIVGLRPGEKIYEELLADGENTIKTHHPKIMVAKVNGQDLLVKRKLIHDLCGQLEQKQSVCVDSLTLVQQLKVIVPEFKSQNSPYEILDAGVAVQAHTEHLWINPGREVG